LILTRKDETAGDIMSPVAQPGCGTQNNAIQNF